MQKSKMNQIMESVENFQHSACNGCPWAIKGMAFGRSCLSHHANWKEKDGADIMSIGQDPGGTTPEHTQNLCAVCNSLNPTDKTAINGLDFLKIMVFKKWDIKRPDMENNPILKRWFVTNSIKHGIPTSRFTTEKQHDLKGYFDSAREHCQGVLKEEIAVLKPKLIISVGVSALNSLKGLGILKHGYKSQREWVENSPHIIPRFYPDNSPLKVFCLYHDSAKVTNQTLSRMFDDLLYKEILKLKEKYPAPSVVESFMNKYNHPGDNGKYTVRNGMFVQLHHRLRLAEVIREVCR